MKKNVTAISVIIGFVMFIGIAIVTDLFKSNDLPTQISGALLEAVVTALITYFLLTGQTSQEEIKERNGKVFEKKQEIYHNFLEELKRIIQDGEIKIMKQGKDAKLDQNIDELKDLIFQLGYLKMHTSTENTNKVFVGVSKIIQLLNNFNSESTNDKDAQLPEYYASLSKELFAIIDILKKDLYNKVDETESTDNSTFKAILEECGLFIENEELNKVEAQNFFWTALQKELQSKGYNIVTKDFSNDVTDYYARARNRIMYFGFSFEIYKSNKQSTPILFHIELGNNYYYGIAKHELEELNTPLINILNEVSPTFKSNKWWCGWKNSDNFDIDFWKVNSEGNKIMTLNDKRKRDAFVKGLAEEIDSYIKRFIVIAEKNNL